MHRRLDADQGRPSRRRSITRTTSSSATAPASTSTAAASPIAASSTGLRASSSSTPTRSAATATTAAPPAAPAGPRLAAEPQLDCGGYLDEEHPVPDPLTPPAARTPRSPRTGDGKFQDAAGSTTTVDASSLDGLWHFDYGCLTLDVTRSPATRATPRRCRPTERECDDHGRPRLRTFKYWAGVVNAAPTASAVGSPKTAAPETDGDVRCRRLVDDLEASDELTYGWASATAATRTGPRPRMQLAPRASTRRL